MEWVDPSGSGDHERLDYYKLPHKDGEKGHCGTPFAKDFMPLIEKGIIRSQFPEIAEVLHQSVSTTYWLSARERILRQFVVDEKDLPRRTFLFDDAADDLSRKGLGAILPTVISSGTVSRRAVEETWLTASNPKKNRLGSELKALVKAPPGAKLVGADVDSQELWIAAVLGDAASTGVCFCD